ncbi:S41 family peptidase [Dyadobacter chenwenxiniae]|uniref:S41 family peptidase n=1 Tax=Dyadobacter chenwenxiniae TaxID=2906456 RepID=A0A9X1PRM5_9BACT|nr:S41 family peptidase [Dyadobacter chenwenxiniae]MCF0063771.1 S41 family peptidase [Dyadobacter chenwenxiniae]UON83447.1 S41 family peptidase [Dyadobacter chenwenxiniae]
MKTDKTPLILILSLIMCLPLSAQQKPSEPNQVLTDQIKGDLISQLAGALRTKYVFEGKADTIANVIVSKFESGAYNNILQGTELASAVTADLLLLSGDKHLRLRYSEKVIPETADNDPMKIPTDQKLAYATELKNSNYGIGKIEVLAGNVGLISFNFFCAPEFSGDTYASAMNYLAHTDALIIDLRKCRGSASIDATPFLSSYLFETPVHLYDLWWRQDSRTMQVWTYAHVPGTKYVKKPVYVLTSFATFSGAEQLAYDLQALKRAKIVGAATSGGANPGGDIRLTDHFSAFMPIGRPINPLTKTNWEGKGVMPDVAVAPARALSTAHGIVLSELEKQTTDDSRQQQIKKIRQNLEQSTMPLKMVNFHLDGYQSAREVFVVGSFNDWTPKANPMRRTNNGWELQTEADSGKTVYQFIIDGKWIFDPKNPRQAFDGLNSGSLREIQ